MYTLKKRDVINIHSMADSMLFRANIFVANLKSVNIAKKNIERDAK